MTGKIKEYDVIVIGSGSGDTIVDGATNHGLTVAWVDRGPLGGTCLNVGCIPSKILIFPADRAMEIREAGKLGIEAEISRIDFGAIMTRMRRIVSNSQDETRDAINTAETLDFYEKEAHFTDSRTLQVGDEMIGADHIFVASGARPLIPSIKGLEGIGYLTNESVLDLRERPGSILIIGGGYIAAEFGHFFAAMGTDVTIVQRNQHLVPDEEQEISELLKRRMAGRMNIQTHTEIVEVERDGSGVSAIGQDVRTGEERTLSAERGLVAAGRRSNADLLQVKNAGIKTDEQGYIKVNEYLETNIDHIWALGDATGQHMFKHVANREAAVAWHNFAHDHKTPMDYTAVPHAVFSRPQIAAVGLTEHRARERFDILVGQASYLDVAKGEAMMETEAFAKAVV
jgi:dihydrolipoamide dehydrogenase